MTFSKIVKFKRARFASYESLGVCKLFEKVSGKHEVQVEAISQVKFTVSVIIQQLNESDTNFLYIVYR